MSQMRRLAETWRGQAPPLHYYMLQWCSASVVAGLAPARLLDSLISCVYTLPNELKTDTPPDSSGGFFLRPGGLLHNLSTVQ